MRVFWRNRLSSLRNPDSSGNRPLRKRIQPILRLTNPCTGVIGIQRRAGAYLHQAMGILATGIPPSGLALKQKCDLTLMTGHGENSYAPSIFSLE